LIFALFYGRVFCAGACPLGAIQDLLVVKPVSTPVWVNKTLGFIPYIYLSLAILFAATGSDFIICRYDPFVAFFRIDGPFTMILLGIIFLISGMFFARPYCRIFCPYGVLLSWMSRFSKSHISITPAECIQCKLCANSCPFDAIDYPTDEKERPALQSKSNRWKFIASVILIPVLVLTGAFIGSKAHIYLSKANSSVYLAELLIARPELKSDIDNLDIQAFLQSGKSMDQLVAEAEIIRTKFYKGSGIMGGFLGLVLGIMLMNQLIFRKRTDYVTNKSDCFSCGRCMDYCPVGKV
jgi:ferredoxin